MGFSENWAGLFELDYYGICKKGTEVYSERRGIREQNKLPVRWQLSLLWWWRLPDFSRHTAAEFRVLYPKWNFAFLALYKGVCYPAKEHKYLLFKKEEWYLEYERVPCDGNSSWELIQDFSSSSAAPGNHPWKRGEVMPELSEKASGGGRVRKDFRTSYAYEMRRTSKYPPTLFSRQTLFPSFQCKS